MADMAKAREMLAWIFAEVGEDGLRSLMMDLGRAQLQTAIACVYNDAWWVARFHAALEGGGAAQQQFLKTLFDKLLPSPQAVKVATEERAQFVVNYDRPPEEHGGEE